jgi:hypothetical protein
MRGGGNIGREAGHPCGVVAVNLAHKRGAGPAWMIVLQSIWERAHTGRIAAAGKGRAVPKLWGKDPHDLRHFGAFPIPPYSGQGQI